MEITLEPPPRSNEFGQPIGFAMPDWKPPPFPPHARLQGRYCRVEPLNASRHARELWDAQGVDAEGKRWTYFRNGPYREFADFESWMRSTETSRDPQHYAIIDETDGHAVGSCAYMRVEPLHGVIEIGHIYFSPQLARTRAATESMYLLMAHAFGLGYRRYEWKCDSCNLPSRASALRFGFTVEGVFRQAMVNKGRNRDTMWFAIIDRDWGSGLGDAYLQWLDPANFDAAGRQRQSLTALTARFVHARP